MPIIGGSTPPGAVDAAFGDADALTPDGLTTTSRMQALAPDAAMDRLRTLGNTASEGLGVLAAAPWIPGASGVLTIRLLSVSDSTTRVTIITPTVGTRVRILSVRTKTQSTTGTNFETYFGTGANIGTTAANAIFEPRLDADLHFNDGQGWPDGGGPVGEVDEVVSARTTSNISGDGTWLIAYREE